MSNYYTHISHLLTLPDESAAQYAKWLAERIDSVYDLISSGVTESDLTTVLKDLPDYIARYIDQDAQRWDITVEARRNTVWLHSDNPDSEVLLMYVLHLMQRYNLPGVERLTCCQTADKPLLDAYGGSFCDVSAKMQPQDLEWVTTSMPANRFNVASQRMLHATILKHYPTEASFLEAFPDVGSFSDIVAMYDRLRMYERVYGK